MSEQERATLRLLGEGHTAKSIAALTGRSISSVNESLRRARQKAGVSSSRELARLLTDNKIVDEQIGLLRRTQARASKLPHLLIAGVFTVMIVIAILAAVSWIAPQKASEVTADPLLPQLMPPVEQDPRRLAELIRSETRDTMWANQAEIGLRQRYSPLVDDGRIEIMRLSCAATACEVVGKAIDSDRARVSATTLSLQASGLNAPVPASQLKHTAIIFGANNLFAAYWVRAN